MVRINRNCRHGRLPNYLLWGDVLIYGQLKTDCCPKIHLMKKIPLSRSARVLVVTKPVIRGGVSFGCIPNTPNGWAQSRSAFIEPQSFGGLPRWREASALEFICEFKLSSRFTAPRSAWPDSRYPDADRCTLSDRRLCESK